MKLAYDLATDKTVNPPSPDRNRVIAACLCLLATVFLYAPLAGAAWSAHSMACCTGDHCPIPQHHHQKAPASDGDCGHEMSGMAACSMSCCQNQDQVTTTGVTFVLPRAPFTPIAMVITSAAEIFGLLEIPRSTKPLSPPPRIAAGIA